MVTIYGRRSSSSVQLVMWAVAELGLEHQRLDYGHGFSPTNTAEFLAKNPMGRVPVMEDGELCLFESAAILRYLGAAYGDDLFWPRDVRARGALDVWAEWGKNTFADAVLDIFVYDVRMAPHSRDPEYLDEATAKLIPLARLLDTRLSSMDFIGGPAFTYADIACGHILYRYFSLNWERPVLPELAAYYERLQTRAAFCEHVMVTYEELRGSY